MLADTSPTPDGPVRSRKDLPVGMPDHLDPDALMKPGDVAQLFHVAPKTISRWEQSGVLSAVRTAGGHRRFATRSVYELVDALGVASGHLEEVGGR